MYSSRGDHDHQTCSEALRLLSRNCHARWAGGRFSFGRLSRARRQRSYRARLTAGHAWGAIPPDRQSHELGELCSGLTE